MLKYRKPHLLDINCHKWSLHHSQTWTGSRNCQVRNWHITCQHSSSFMSTAAISTYLRVKPGNEWLHPSPGLLCRHHCWSELLRQHTTTHTHTHLSAFYSGTTRLSWYQKSKTNLDFTEARDSEWQWAICKSAPRSRQITMPAPHHSVFYGPDALPAAKPTASKHWSTPQHNRQILTVENIQVQISEQVLARLLTTMFRYFKPMTHAHQFLVPETGTGQLVPDTGTGF